MSCEQQTNYKIVLAGALGVGKTTIYDVVKKHWSSGREESSKWIHCVELNDRERVTITLWDAIEVESHECRFKTRSDYFCSCDGVILVCTQSRLTTLQDLTRWIQDVNENSFASRPVFTLWCNAIDQYQGTEVTEDLMESFANEHDVCFHARLPDMNNTVIRNYKQLLQIVHLTFASCKQTDSKMTGEMFAVAASQNQETISVKESQGDQGRVKCNCC